MKYPRVSNAARNTLASIFVVITFTASSWSAENVSITQCANFKAGTGDHDTCDFWTSGNVNKQKATYFEGDSVAYRYYIIGLDPAKNYRLTMQWDATQKDKNALDYITSYNETVVKADVCQDLGTTLCDEPPAIATVAIPIDDVRLLGRSNTSVMPSAQIPGVITLWGAENTVSVSGDYVYDPEEPASDPPPYDSTTKISLAVNFNPIGTEAIVAIGGHISTRMDWDDFNSAINITGSPYHMRLIDLRDMSGGEPGDPVAQGSQDVQLSADAVFFPTSLSIFKDAGGNNTQSFPFTYEIGNDGTVAFSLTGGDPDIGTGEVIEVSDDATIEVVEDLSGLPAWTLDDISCFSGPNMDAFAFTRMGSSLTVDLSEGDIVSCTFENSFNASPSLLVDKQVFTNLNTDCTTVWGGALSKSVEVQRGDSVKYCYRVRNEAGATGAAEDVTLEDDLATGDFNSGTSITLFGGDAGGTAGSPPTPPINLGPSSVTYGALVQQIDAEITATVTNTARADASNADPVQDTAQVTLAEDLDCSVTAGVVLQGNDCSGATGTLNGVLTSGELDVTWCSEVCWDGSANSGGDYKLQATTLSLLDPNETPNIPEDDFVLQGPIPADPNTLGAGECGSGSFDETLTGDTLRRLLANGVWGVADEISEECSDSASVNILNPEINLTKKVSTASNCANPQDEITVYYGTEVYYCFGVANNGDEDLDAVRLSDDDLPGFPSDPNAIFSESSVLASSGTWSYQFPDSSPGIAITQASFMNTATVVGTGIITDVDTAPSMDSAKVNTWYVDLEIVKTGTNQLREFDDAWSYSFRVRNLGTGDAANVVLTDDDIALPSAFVPTLPLPNGCSIASDILTCTIGTLAPYSSSDSSTEINITINGTYQGTGSDGPFTNEACVASDQAEVIDNTNNCDTHTTRVSPGATRTIGFWRNHPVLLKACLDDIGDIDLGFLVIADGLVDAQVSTAISSSGKGKKSRKNFVGLHTPVTVAATPDSSQAIEYALGILKAHTSKFSNGQSRSHLDQARIQAGRQVLAAICNNQYLGAENPEPNWFDTAADVLGGSDRGAILSLGGTADAYNNAGDSDPLPPYAAALQSNADPSAADDDPTDPEGVALEDMPTCIALGDPDGCP